MTYGSEYDEQLKAPKTLKTRFRGQGQQGLVLDRPRAARQARRVSGGISALVALVAIVLTGVRLDQSGEAGAWTVLYLAGGVVSGCGVLLARFGRTRCAFAAICVGAGIAMLGDGPMFG
ncbi:hypothetical protein [Streptomyces fractus]|uniref:hypothetical protein n=1 Tax=Streptomyces fractus TaxID=641806 RepID=UPI003CE71747